MVRASFRTSCGGRTSGAKTILIARTDAQGVLRVHRHIVAARDETWSDRVERSKSSPAPAVVPGQRSSGGLSLFSASSLGIFIRTYLMEMEIVTHHSEKRMRTPGESRIRSDPPPNCRPFLPPTSPDYRHSVNELITDMSEYTLCYWPGEEQSVRHIISLHRRARLPVISADIITSCAVAAGIPGRGAYRFLPSYFGTH